MALQKTWVVHINTTQSQQLWRWFHSRKLNGWLNSGKDGENTFFHTAFSLRSLKCEASLGKTGQKWRRQKNLNPSARWPFQDTRNQIWFHCSDSAVAGQAGFYHTPAALTFICNLGLCVQWVYQIFLRCSIATKKWLFSASEPGK